MKIKLEFKAADIWLGLFWARKRDILHIWICLLPCLPLHILIPLTRWQQARDEVQA